MSGNMIWRGRIDKQPHSLNLPTAAAILPGTMVEQTASDTLAVLTTATEKNFYVLGEMDVIGRSIATEYASGETAIAYEAEPKQIFQCRLASATYAKGDALTIAASGRLAAAGAAQVVVAYFDDTPGAYAAGALADVIIANAHTNPAA